MLCENFVWVGVISSLHVRLNFFWQFLFSSFAIAFVAVNFAEYKFNSIKLCFVRISGTTLYVSLAYPFYGGPVPISLKLIIWRYWLKGCGLDGVDLCFFSRFVMVWINNRQQCNFVASTLSTNARKKKKKKRKQTDQSSFVVISSSDHYINLNGTITSITVVATTAATATDSTQLSNRRYSIHFSTFGKHLTSKSVCILCYPKSAQ